MELENVLSEIDSSLFSDVKAQLLKDVEMSGLSISTNFNTPKTLFEGLLLLINEENKNTPQALMNLLYRVDVKEMKIHEISQELNVSFEEALAIGILNRIIEKVQFKKKYTN